jgi:hypothetical protein
MLNLPSKNACDWRRMKRIRGRRLTKRRLTRKKLSNSRGKMLEKKQSKIKLQPKLQAD